MRAVSRADLNDLLTDLKLAPEAYRSHSDDDVADMIDDKLREAAGHSAMNGVRKWRGQCLPYRQILIDVADKLTAGPLTRSPFRLSSHETETEIEDYIYARLQDRISKHLAKLSANDKARLQEKLAEELRRRGTPETTVQAALGAFASGGLSGLLLGSVMTSLLYGGVWTTVFGFSLSQTLLGGVLAGGPVGALLAAASVLAAPAYSKTVPAVCRLVVIRDAVAARTDLDMPS